MAKLTNKQALFCKEYIVDLNATASAKRAGYSEKTAEAIGFENLRKPLITEEIQRLMSKRASKVSITAEDVLQSIIDTRDICLAHTTYIDSQGNKRADTAAVNGIHKANELLGKHLKLYTDKVEHSGKIDISAKTDMINKYLEE